MLKALYGLRFAADYADLNAMEGIDSLRSAEMACLAYKVTLTLTLTLTTTLILTLPTNH